MRVRPWGRAVAVATAMTVGLTVPAVAEEAPEPPQEPTPVTGSSVRVVELKLRPGTTPTRSGMKVLGRVRVEHPDVQLWSLRADLTVNNRLVAKRVTLSWRDPQPVNGINYARRYGAGVVRLTNIRASGYDHVTKERFDDLAIPFPKNATRVRYVPDKYKTRLTATRGQRNRTVLRAVAVYRDKHEKLRSAQRAVIQHRAPRGKWRVLRTVGLNRAGKARLVVRAPKNRAYRLVVRQRPLLAAFRTAPVRAR